MKALGIKRSCNEIIQISVPNVAAASPLHEKANRGKQWHAVASSNARQHFSGQEAKKGHRKTPRPQARLANLVIAGLINSVLLHSTSAQYLEETHGRISMCAQYLT